jgi:hypothetical protein
MSRERASSQFNVKIELQRDYIRMKKGAISSKKEKAS